MKNRSKEHWSATPAEFRNTVESEFKFLHDNYGYVLKWSDSNPFEANFILKETQIEVTGTGYGFGAAVNMIVKGEQLPFWTITTKMNKRFAPSTDKPQLDDLREYAYRLRNECQDILHGDFTRLNEARRVIEEQKRKIEEARQADKKGLFFSKADKLWKNKEYAELTKLLIASPYALSESWTKRLEYSKKHV